MEKSEDDTMINKIDSRLKREGYRFLKVKPEEAGVYYRYVDGTAQVVVGFYGHDGFWLDSRQIELLSQNLRELFFHPWGRLDSYPEDAAIHDVKILMLFVTEHPERYKELCSGNLPVWIYDAGMNRLLIYENQPGDFFGIRAALESAGDGQARQDSGNESSPTNDVSRELDWNRIPFVSVGLAAVNVIVFLVLTFFGDTEDAVFMMNHGAVYPELVADGGEWYRLFTCMFLHFGVEHLMNNMVLLVVAGAQLEHALGKIKYLLLYLIAGLGSSILSLIMMIKTGDLAVSAGASGAVYGIIGALLWVAIRNRGKFENLTARGLVIMIGLCLYFGFSTTGVDNWGHVGGLISGFVLCVLLYRKRRR